MLTWLETSSIAVWLGESPSIWALPTVLTLHTTGMAVLVGASWMLDLRVLGVNRQVPLSAYRWVFPAITLGLVVNLFTGILLFMKNASTWGTAFPFLVKMLLVAAGGATLLPLRKYVRNAPEGEVAGNARMLAIVSIVAWTGAVTAGRLLAYVVQ